MSTEIDIRPPEYAKDKNGRFILDDNGNKIWSGATRHELKHYRDKLEIAQMALRIIANDTCSDHKETARQALKDSEP